jgi:hypothetical protein
MIWPGGAVAAEAVVRVGAGEKMRGPDHLESETGRSRRLTRFWGSNFNHIALAPEAGLEPATR